MHLILLFFIFKYMWENVYIILYLVHDKHKPLESREQRLWSCEQADDILSLIVVNKTAKLLQQHNFLFKNGQALYK